MADKTTWQIIEDRMKQLSKLHERMDASKDLAYSADFKLKKFGSTEDMSRVVNVTGNYAAVFANAIVSDLEGVKWQTVVEGDINSRQTHDIEQFIEDNFEQADEFLLNRFGFSSLYAWLCNHVCIRSLIGVRWVSTLTTDEEYQIDCLPVDMRYTAFRFGKNGLGRVAPTSFWNEEDLLEEYPDVSLGIKGSEIEVRDYWTDKLNEVWVGQKKAFEQKHSLGKPPFVIVFPSAGFMLRDKDYLEHESEDLFFLIRKLIPEMNRSLSIEQTLGMDILRPGTEQEKEFSDEADPPALTGESKVVGKGERHFLVPRGDVNRASLTADQKISGMVELGSISPAELGSAALDRPGIWFAKQFEIRHKLEKSRFEALAIMKEGLARLMIDQFLKASEEGGAGEVKIGSLGRKNKFTPKMLGDPDSYRISFKYGMSSKEMEIINLAQAQAARGIVPERYIVRDILKAEDPDGWFRELELEKAKQANPAIGLAEMAVRYAEESEEMEDGLDADLKKWQSMMLVHDYVMLMRQRINPQPSPEAPQEARKSQEPSRANMQGLASLPKLLGGGGMIGRRQEQPTEVVK